VRTCVNWCERLTGSHITNRHKSIKRKASDIFFQQLYQWPCMSKRINASLTTYHAQNNGVGILSMPHELLLEITYYLGPLFDRIGGDFLGRRLPYRMNTERRQTLLSLSQCCRFLRSFFLPLAWECFDIYSPIINYDDDEIQYDHRDITKNLELKSKALVENPELGAHVRYEYFATTYNQPNSCYVV
jgi:hypothetical protein